MILVFEFRQIYYEQLPLKLIYVNKKGDNNPYNLNKIKG
jgi:hypothetical protein|tara:strand:- start:41 stop:157 length:117 start_codon:yes stop_codon:yes gene_type:complete